MTISLKTLQIRKSETVECLNLIIDGLDVDWEYPGGGDIETYIDLLSTLKEAFEPKGYLVTVAVNSIPYEVGGYDIAAMSK